MSSPPLQSAPNSALSNPGLPPGLSEDQPQSSALALLGVLRDALNAGDHSPEEILTAAVNAARVLTGAFASAIGLRTNGSVVCRARSGDVAPELGAALNVESGISGACFRSAVIMQCDDAQTDDRVDSEVCRLLGINSIVAMPLRDATGTIGILEVFSNRAFAFSAEDIAFLKELSQIAEIAYRRELEAKNPTAVPLPLSQAQVIPVSAAFARTAMLPPAVREQREHQQRELKISPVIPQPAPQKISRRYWIMSIVAALILMACVVIWWTWHEPEGESTQTVAQAHTAPASASSSSAIELQPKPSPRISGAQLDRSSGKNVLKNAAGIEAVDDENTQPQRTLNANNASSSPTELTSGEATLRSVTSTSVAEPPPTVLANVAENGDKLASIVSTSAPLPSLEVRVSQGVTQASLIHKVDPVYPREAILMRLSGSVTLNTSVAEDGKVSEVKVVHGHPMLAEAAVAAVRQWRYGPSLLNGKPITVQKEVTVIFKLP
jgi:TonB family protein